MSRARANRRRGQAGFTLLEAIVALVVMATTLITLYGWLGSSTIALTRARANADALQDARSALALVETINPMRQPSGERALDPLTVRWDAKPITDRRNGLSQAGLPTPFDFILYDVKVEVLRDKRPVREFQVRRVGWEIARSNINPDEW